MVTGVIGGDELDYTLARAPGENTGEYAITVSPGMNRNYNVAAAGAVFTIAKASAEVAAEAKTKRYGEEDPELTATVTGVIGDDELAYTLARTPGENAGEYAIAVSPGTNRNYNVAAAGAVFTIAKADAAVAAEAKTKRYGEKDPELTATVTGVIGSDELAYTLARAPGENAGEYAITVSPGTNRNYNVKASGAAFTITKADTAVVTPPGAKKLIETGSPQELVTDGTAEGGEMHYALGGDLPFAWSAHILTATAAGTYIVWYKAAGDGDHLDSIPQKLTAEIIAAPDFGPAKLTVPAGAIGKNAFQGDRNVTIVDASRCGQIGANAFGSSGIRQIRLPKGCAIDETAFMGCGTIFVFAPAGGRTEADCGKIKNCFL